MRPLPTRTRVTGSPSRRAPVLTVATALVATLLGAVPVAAAAGPGLAPAAAKPKPGKPAATESEQAVKASAEAKRTGKRVEIISQRTENEEVWANPDGSFSTEQALVPIRVHRGGKLVPVDTGLAKQKDGRIATKATRTGLTFSGGGTAPLVTMRKDGRDVSLTWPKPLPKPTVEGNSATYPEVLKGVDLRVAADATGFSHQLIVKNREAAANPELGSLTFGLKGNGVSVRKEANGELQAVDPSGQTVFSSAKPQMWDSGAEKTAAPQPAADAKSPAAKAPAAAPAAAPTAQGDGTPVTEGIDLGSKQADLGIDLKGDKLTLTTDRQLLTAADTAYPVVIDPKWRDDWKSAWTVAYKHNGIAGTADTNYWNGGTLSDDARVGCAKDAAKGGAVVCAKTFFQVPMGNLWGKKIHDATLRIQQKSAGSWSCKSGDIQVWDTDVISKKTTWNNQPDWNRMVDASGQSYGGRNCPGDGDTIELDVTSAVAAAASGKWPTWTLGLKAAKDTVDVSWRKMNPDSVRISTKYNTVPTVSERTTDPYVPCTGGTIGRTDQVVLRARVKDAEDNGLTAEFHYWRADDYSGTLKKVSDKKTSGSVAMATIPAPTDGTYKWDVKVSDGTDASAWAGQCSFTVDLKGPTFKPKVSSAQFPEDNQTDNGYARTEGTFKFENGGATDVAKYQWYTSDNPTVRTAVPTAKGGPVEVKYTPLAAGPHSLYVWSLDAAGNSSNKTFFQYYAKRPLERDKHGDVNGDGQTDIWSVDPGDGQLWVVPGTAGGAFGVPRKTDYGNFAGARSLTQWGSWNEGDYYEDLIALEPSADATRQNLYVYRGAGNGELENPEASRIELNTRYDDNDHWANADQVLAIGSVNDDPLPDQDSGDGKIDEADQADLLVKTGGELWLYFGQPDGVLDRRSYDPIPLGNADWQDMTLIAPGDLNKDGLPELWARDKTSGKIHQYTSRPSTDPASKAGIDLAVYGEAAARTQSIGTGFTGAARPHLTSLGDFEKDGFADLWSRDNNGVLWEFQGRQPVSGSAFGAPRQIAVGGTPWSQCENVASVTAGTTQQLCGPILAKFKAKGGVAYAKPSGKVTENPDGGKFVHLRTNGATSDNASIYWHPSTGAWLVVNGIRAKWIALGAEKGVMGYPTSDESKTFDEVGSFSTFSGSGGAGAIYWTPDLGAWSVHGGIYNRYVQMGGPSRLGYPTTDETNLTDGKGRYNHFRKRGQTADSASIYWTSATGAHPVYGQIRAKWIALGAEKSTLGYPKSDEYEVAAGPRADFTGGYIRYNRTTGVATNYSPNHRTADQRTDLSGDFNGDGRSDLATVYDYGDNTTALWVLNARADGGYEEPTVRWTSAKGSFSYARAKWVAGDFNGDGRTDIGAVYGYADGSNALWNFLSNENGTFTPVKGLTAAVGNFDWDRGIYVAGDYNGDGRSDIAMVYDYSDGAAGLHTWTGNANGTFNSGVASWRVGTGNWWIFHASFRSGDVNGDGRDDIMALYGYTAGGVAMFTFIGQPNGGFAAPVKSWTKTKEQWDYARTKFTVGDYNGDGRADAALMYDHGDGHASLDTLLGQPDGKVGAELRSWDTPEGNWYASSAGMPVSGDADGDGRDDVSSMYNYATGATSAFTFKSRPDGGFENPSRSWQALPGTW
ncbi:FG-GAP-like repeat-containing protein [Streptomyces sp. NPDC002054]|uniref:FG-GAP-like repeat-containing protein n=1 Tax=Streptomyces sp. NPDC002054 TaxID=3154663 RepID=UPI003328795B